MEGQLNKKERILVQMAMNQLEKKNCDVEKAWENVKRRTNPGNKNGRTLLFRYIIVFVVLLTGGGAVWILGGKDNTDSLAENQQTNFSPTGVKAELILATGERILLDSPVGKNNIIQPGGVLSFNPIGKQLQYQDHRQAGDTAMCYNILRIPKGGEYRLTLSDGTRVWLNAESSLRYPVNFGENQREIELDGEAFLEVARDESRPFRVRSGERIVEVLGTRFNVSAYGGDKYWHTTLAEGRVKIISNGKASLLEPSQQYREDKGSGVGRVDKVEVTEYISWIDGKISFRGERLEDIIRKLSRWYDFHLFYANEEIKDMRFRGVINKYQSFEVVLKNLEQTTNIHFDIKGNTIIARKVCPE